MIAGTQVDARVAARPRGADEIGNLLTAILQHLALEPGGDLTLTVARPHVGRQCLEGGRDQLTDIPHQGDFRRRLDHAHRTEHPVRVAELERRGAVPNPQEIPDRHRYPALATQLRSDTPVFAARRFQRIDTQGHSIVLGIGRHPTSDVANPRGGAPGNDLVAGRQDQYGVARARQHAVARARQVLPDRRIETGEIAVVVLAGNEQDIEPHLVHPGLDRSDTVAVLVGADRRGCGRMRSQAHDGSPPASGEGRSAILRKFVRSWRPPRRW